MTGRPHVHRRLTGRWWRRDDGQVTAFVVVFMTGLLALAGLTFDGGLALSTAVRADGQAQAAARAGAQAIDLEQYRTTGTVRLAAAEAVVNARRQLASDGASGTVTVVGDTVTVSVTASQPTQLLRLVGIHAISVHGEGSAHPQPEVGTVLP